MERFDLSTQQASDQLGLHRSTVLRLVEEGKLEARVFTYGSRPTVRISQGAIDPWESEAGRG
jgi:excisionase family DNA binding protein